MIIFVTGGTGFLGSELIRALLFDNTVTKIITTVRPCGGVTPQARFDKVVDQWRRFELPFAEHRLPIVQVLDCDLAVGPVPDIPTVDIVFHTAANTSLSSTLDVARRDNVIATQRLVQLCRQKGVRGRFVHFSTAYVAGQRRGIVDATDKPKKFHNEYERSKWESEDAVRHSGLPFTILRPSIVVGRSDNGYVMRQKVLYSVWRIWLAGVVPRAPLDPKSLVDIVPVDYVTEASLELAKARDAVDRTFLLCSGTHSVSPTAIMNAAVEAFSVKQPPISPPWVAYALALPPFKWFTNRTLREALESMYHHIPYLGIRGRVFDDSSTREILAKQLIRVPRFQDYSLTLFRFCKDTSWGKKPLRTREVA